MEYTLRFDEERHWYPDEFSSETMVWTFEAVDDDEALKLVSEFFSKRDKLRPRVLQILNLLVIRQVNIPPELLVRMMDAGQVSIA